MKKLSMDIDNKAEDSEFLYPYCRFQEEGYKMDVVGTKANRKARRPAEIGPIT